MKKTMPFILLCSFFLFCGTSFAGTASKDLSNKISFLSEKVFFKTFSESLAQEMTASESNNAVKIFKKTEKWKSFESLVDLSEAQPTSAQNIIFNIKGFGSKVSENDLQAFKFHLFELAVAEIRKKDNKLENASIVPVVGALVSILVFAGSSNNESAPTVTLASSASSISENAGSSLTLTATMSAATTEDVTVSISTSGTGTEGTDHATISDITISAGSTTGTASFTPMDDNTYEGDETAIVAINGVLGGSASDSGTQTTTITIIENETAPTVSLGASGTSVYDNGSNITLTATSTIIADEAITVAIGTSGTATEGTDYATISNITIAAGDTTGTATFNPTEDTSNEDSEVATISISSVSGAGSSTSGTTSVTITITEYALLTKTNFADSASDSITAATVAAQYGYVNIDTTDRDSTVHPYTQMNINDVHAMTDGTNYLTGVGQIIHIADFNCNTNLDIYDGKTIYNLDNGGVGESTFSNDTSTDYHCNAVATFAAGNDQTGINFTGVAPDADLVLSSIPNTEGTYAGDDFADDLDRARGYGAIVSNNSWGQSQIASEFDTFYETYKASYSLTQLAGLKFANGGSFVADQTSAFQAYITALDNFQTTGVIVFANGNDNTKSDASWIASLPYWYKGGTDGQGNAIEDLSDAWLSVLYADFTGSDMVDITESEFTLKGNPCGKAREFCLTVDDYQILSTSWYDEGDATNNYSEGSGSSYGAPMVSGGVALVKQAFPNHTPEQIVDRILASANNEWFTAAGHTTFTTHGGSITHGYHNTWGHGLPDFLAAMSPITSSSNPASLTTSSNLRGNSGEDSSGPASNSSNSQGRYDISSTTLSVASLMGDAISEGLKNETAYFYDGLNGGFKFNMSSLVNDDKNTQKPLYNPQKYSSNLGQSRDNKKLDLEFNATNVLLFTHKTDKNTYFTLEAPNAALQKFASFTNGNNIYSGIQTNPFIGKTKGLGFNSEYTIGNIKAVVGYHNSVFQGEQLNSDLKSQTLAASFEIVTDKDTKVELLVGTLHEKDTFLFSKGRGALGYHNSNPKSLFTGLNLGKRFSNLSFSLSGTLAGSRMDNADNSLIEGTSNVISSSMNASMSLYNLGIKGNKLSFSVGQPNRIEKGFLKIRMPGLADINGDIPYTYKDLNLRSSGRQLDLNVNYMQSFNNGVDMGINLNLTKDYNHVNDNNSGINLGLVSQYKW